MKWMKGEKIVKTEKSMSQKETFGSLRLTGAFLEREVNPGLLEGENKGRMASVTLEK